MFRIGQLKRNLAKMASDNDAMLKHAVATAVHNNKNCHAPTTEIMAALSNPDSIEWEGPVSSSQDCRHLFRVKPWYRYQDLIIVVQSRMDSPEILEISPYDESNHG